VSVQGQPESSGFRCALAQRAAGFALALIAACDVVIASQDSRYTTAYASLGASANGGTTWLLPRLMGMRKARELILLADQGLRLDLVNRLVAPDQLHETARQQAVKLANGPTRAYAHVKRLLARSFETSLEEQLEEEQAAFLEGVTSQDFPEGIAAFVGKRKPGFSGR
jgi:2-(1,2-epoxy-1,2-dihydrophenyl)acetyl-CoA isomerase